MEALLPRELLSLRGGHLTLILHVLLVRDEEDQGVRVCLVLDFVEPAVEVHEAVHARQVVREEDSVRAAIENLCDRLEALLAGRVPDLQLEACVFHFDPKGAELDANRAVVLRVEPVLRQSVQNARFAHS